jgi:hypothetical protein
VRMGQEGDILPTGRLRIGRLGHEDGFAGSGQW